MVSVAGTLAFRHSPKCFEAALRRMTIRVVDGFEVLNVLEHQGEGSLLALKQNSDSLSSKCRRLSKLVSASWRASCSSCASILFIGVMFIVNYSQWIQARQESINAAVKATW